jgi:predicted O-methyltransferase YrrM
MLSQEQTFINAEHTEIFDQTKQIPGWQEPGDSFKLYEMAYQSGDVILEIGTYGGRSAVVELRGALANPARAVKPQFFGLDVDLTSVRRTYDSLKQNGLNSYALLYHGDLQSFSREFAIRPTMVFVDGDHTYLGVKRDLALLSNILSPGTPVLCHDFLNPENETGQLGVRKATTEWQQEGNAEFIGAFGCSGFFITTTQCRGQAQERLTAQEFAERKAALLETYCHQLYLDLQNTQVEVRQLQTQLEQAQRRIVAMESSKFWQLRQAWFGVKKTQGLPSNE